LGEPEQVGDPDLPAPDLQGQAEAHRVFLHRRLIGVALPAVQEEVPGASGTKGGDVPRPDMAADVLRLGELLGQEVFPLWDVSCHPRGKKGDPRAVDAEVDPLFHGVGLLSLFHCQPIADI
jgi:hypothetical protein